jgi:NAD(P)H-dependent FMN reductase
MTTNFEIPIRDTPVRLAVIVASTREGRFAPTITNWFTEQLRHRVDVEFDVIDLADVNVPMTFGPAAAHSIASERERVGRADAFVVITPEYNHSYPAVLKQFIDLIKAEWQAKPVSFVSYGGMSGGLRAVEHLRNVFTEMHTVTIRDIVSFHNPWAQFDVDASGRGELREADQPNAAAKVMLDELVWFANALRTARAEHPYAA